MKNLLWHLPVLIVYFGLLLGCRLLWRGVESVMTLEGVWLVVGGVLGVLVPVWDRMIYVYFTAPGEQLSMMVRESFKHGRWWYGMGTLMSRREEQMRLATNNVLFLAVWCLLGVFVMTSSGSELAKGLVLGMGLDMAFDLYKDWIRPQYLMNRLFWPIKRQISWRETEIVVKVFWVGFVVVSVLGV